MFPAVMSNSTSVSEKLASISSGARVQEDFTNLNPILHKSIPHQPQNSKKKKRNLPGNPDPDAEVIALSPKSLLATNRFVCEICNKGFQRDQNLQLHRRGHNLPWKLKQKNSREYKKRVYVCPEPTCVHHHPTRALGDLTGIKKHYCRKHGEKKWKCEKCSRIYAVQSDWKAHSKTCGTREYRCDCGALFSRKDSFITHRAFCDALAEESARLSAATHSIMTPNFNSNLQPFNFSPQSPPPLPPPPPTPTSFLPFSSHNHHSTDMWDPLAQNPNPNSHAQNQVHIKHEPFHIPLSLPIYQERSMMASPLGDLYVGATLPPLSATALLQKAATVGSAGHVSSTTARLDMHMHMHTAWQKSDRLTRDFLGLAGDQCGGNVGGVGGGGSGDGSVRELLSCVEFPPYDHDRSLLKYRGFIFTETCPETWGNC